MATTAEPVKQIQVKLVGARLSYPNLFTPKGFNEQDTNPKYSASFILDDVKDAGQIATVRAAINQLVAENKLGKLPSDKLCLRNGADKDKAGYGEGTHYVSASNTRAPQVVDTNANGRSPIGKDDSRIFGGCYVNAVLNLWVQNNQYGKRVNASLEAVQYVRPGEAFGAAPVDADDAFGSIPDDDDGSDIA